MNRSFTKKDHDNALMYNHCATNGGKNAREVWFRGEVFPSIIAVGKSLKLGNPSMARNYIAKGYTPDFEIMTPYNEQTFEKDHKIIKTRILALLEGKLTSLIETINRVEKC